MDGALRRAGRLGELRCEPLEDSLWIQGFRSMPAQQCVQNEPVQCCDQFRCIGRGHAAFDQDVDKPIPTTHQFHCEVGIVECRDDQFVASTSATGLRPQPPGHLLLRRLAPGEEDRRPEDAAPPRLSVHVGLRSSAVRCRVARPPRLRRLSSTRLETQPGPSFSTSCSCCALLRLCVSRDTSSIASSLTAS